MEKIMTQVPEQLVASGRANLENAKRFAGVALEGVERIAKLQLEGAKEALNEGVKNTEALLAVKNAQELAGVQTAIVEAGIEKAVIHSRSVYQAASETQAEITKLVEGQAEEFNKHVLANLDKVLKSAPAGSEAAVAAVRSAVEAANTAYDNISKAAKQVVEITEANVNAAAQAVNRKKKAA